jgi:hypothetical protein
MNAKIEKLVIGGIEVPVNALEDVVFGAADMVDAIERVDTFDYVVSTSSSYISPMEGVPSKPLSAGAIRVLNSVLDARVPESAIRRDINGDY